ncbi:MAG: hypothetical protein HY901_22065 [Deltaproteobacteria bacterium]|nr:hypothetical protein [Deltaproteobacteria bacterium]
MALKYRFIANPTARGGRGRRQWPEIRSMLEARQVSYEWRESEHAGHSVELAREAAGKGVEVVVAVGGDGTINEVLGGVMSAPERAQGRGCALGIVYTGTSPDVCRFHRIPFSPTRAAVEVLLRDRRSKVDVGRVEYFESNDSSAGFASDRPPVIGYFLCAVNLGVGAAVATGSNSGLRKVLGDGLGTFASIVAAVAAYRHADFDCRVDGAALRTARTLNLTIGKNPFIASGLKVLVPVEHDDGRLYLFAVNGFGMLGLLANLHRFYRGSFQEDPRNTLTYLSEFECAYNEVAHMVEFDGDHRGYLPCRIKVLQRALDLVK